MPRLALVIWLCLVGALTLTPAPEAIPAADLTPWWCLSCGEIGTADLFQNLLLFLPVGLLLRQLGWRRWSALSIGLAMTLAIELVQAVFLPGRDAALSDVVANVAGVATGWALHPALRALAAPTAAVAHRTSAITLIGFALQLLASSWLLRPAPGDATWQVERAPRHHDGTQWPAPVGAVTLEHVVDAVAFVTATRWPAEAPRERATIARLTRGPTDVVAGVSIAPGTITAGLRTHTRDLRLRSPVGTVPTPAIAVGEALTVRLEHRPGAMTLAGSTSSGATSSASVAIGAQHGWVLINPFTASVDLTRAWDRWTCAWLFGWGLLLGFGAGATPGWRRWAIAAAVVGLGVPWLSGTPLGGWELASLAAGWVLAAAVGQKQARGHPQER